jgi:NAD(P)-dependent dehydrogenase (short-subunit alcohol dehydrogenase family)
MKSWRRVCTIQVGCRVSIILANTKDKGIPVGRLGGPDEIAETVVWMVKTGYLTNKVVGVDGGWFPQ